MGMICTKIEIYDGIKNDVICIKTLITYNISVIRELNLCKY